MWLGFSLGFDGSEYFVKEVLDLPGVKSKPVGRFLLGPQAINPIEKQTKHHSNPQFHQQHQTIKTFQEADALALKG